MEQEQVSDYQPQNKSSLPMALLISPAPIDAYPPVQNQAKLLADAGFKVLVLSSHLKRGADSEFSNLNVAIIRLPLSAQALARRLARLRYMLHLIWWRLRFYNHLKVEISYDPEGMFYSGICPLKPGVRIAHFHELILGPEFLGKSWALTYEKYIRHTIHKFNLVVAADAHRATLLQKQLALSTVPCVVRNLPLLHDDKQKGTNRLENKGKPEKFSVVYHGAIGFTQALDSIVASMKYWPTDVNFHLYGTPAPDMLEKLKQIARDCGVEKRIIFEGWVPTNEIVSRLQQHSLGTSTLRPSNDKNRFAVGASNKRYQYMQAGIPQISDRNPGVPELIEKNHIGLCISPEDPAAIAEAVCFFYENEKIRKEYGARARKLYETEFYYEKEFAPVIKFIQDKCKT